MGKRDSVFDRLALKEKLFINKQMRNIGTLKNEFQKIEEVRIKLSEMAEETGSKKCCEQTIFSLRSSAELNSQIRDQLDTANNRSEYLGEELKSIQHKVALSSRRREKSINKAEKLRRVNRDQRIERREDEESSRRRVRFRQK